MDIRSAQKRAWQNKVAKGFNTTDVPLDFCLLQGEMAEAFDAWRRDREDLGEELADVAIYLLGLAEMTGFDLQDEIEAKMANRERRRRLSHQPRRGAHPDRFFVDERASRQGITLTDHLLELANGLLAYAGVRLSPIKYFQAS